MPHMQVKVDQIKLKTFEPKTRSCYITILIANSNPISQQYTFESPEQMRKAIISAIKESEKRKAPSSYDEDSPLSQFGLGGPIVLIEDQERIEDKIVGFFEMLAADVRNLNNLKDATRYMEKLNTLRLINKTIV